MYCYFLASKYVNGKSCEKHWKGSSYYMRGKVIEKVRERNRNIIDISVTDFVSKEPSQHKTTIFHDVCRSDIIMNEAVNNILVRVGTYVAVIKQHNKNQGFELMKVDKVKTTTDGEIFFICKDNNHNKFKFSGTRIGYLHAPSKNNE